jgi:hypothetical protein
VTAGQVVLPVASDEVDDRPFWAERSVLALAAVYYLFAALAVTFYLWRDPASRMVAGNPNDGDQFTWFFRYDAAAVAHFHLPALVTTAMNAPQGVNAMWNTFMLLPGTVLAPVTLLFGPQVSLNVFLVLGFAGSALAMFWVLRRWGCSLWGASVGGAVYGFCPAVLHSALGHYDLMFMVLPPLLVDGALRLGVGLVPWLRGGVVLGLLVVAQIFITEEMLFDTAIAGLLIAAVVAASRWRLVVAGWRNAVRGFGVAFLVVLVVAGYPLWVQFFGPLPQHGSPFTLDFFKNDLLGLVNPSALQVLHTGGTAAMAAGGQARLPEYLGYVGWPLLLFLPWVAARYWRSLTVRALAVTWVVLLVFSLGGTLMVNGHGHPAVKLPWYWVQSLPLLNAVIPDRFSLLAGGAMAALLAFGVDALAGDLAGRFPLRLPGRRSLALATAVTGLAALPLLPRPLPVYDGTPVPAGWTAVFRSLQLSSGAPVLVVPVPVSLFTEPLRWQADTGYPSSFVGGYFMGPAWNGQAYIDGNGTPQAAEWLNQLWAASSSALPPALTAEIPPSGVPSEKGFTRVQPLTPAKMRAQLTAWHVAAVVAVTTPDSAVATYLTALLGPPAASSGTVIAWRP